jgi:hypothetical protein
LLTLIRIRIQIFLRSYKLDLGELFDIFQAQHDLKNIGGVTVKFKSGVHSERASCEKSRFWCRLLVAQPVGDAVAI